LLCFNAKAKAKKGNEMHVDYAMMVEFRKGYWLSSLHVLEYSNRDGTIPARLLAQARWVLADILTQMTSDPELLKDEVSFTKGALEYALKAPALIEAAFTGQLQSDYAC
jgi:hypothetical protein